MANQTVERMACQARCLRVWALLVGQPSLTLALGQNAMMSRAPKHLLLAAMALMFAALLYVGSFQRFAKRHIYSVHLGPAEFAFPHWCMEDVPLSRYQLRFYRPFMCLRKYDLPIAWFSGSNYTRFDPPTAQPGGPANGSQPIRSGTDSTSPTAGSRR